MLRRSFLRLFSAISVVPLAAAAKAAAPPDSRIKRDPHEVLRRYTWEYERNFEHKWDIGLSTSPTWGSGLYSYAGAGGVSGPPATNTYSHQYIRGIGNTALGAIDGWRSNLPDGKFYALVWRHRPGLGSQINFDTKETEWQVYSRMAIIPTKPVDSK